MTTARTRDDQPQLIPTNAGGRSFAGPPQGAPVPDHPDGPLLRPQPLEGCTRDRPHFIPARR